MCTLLVEYVPSLHIAVAPAGAPAGARAVGIWVDGVFPAAGPAGAAFGAGAAALFERLERGFVDVRRDELGVDFAAGCDAAEARDDVFRDVTRLATPPCPEQRPLDDVAVE